MSGSVVGGSVAGGSVAGGSVAGGSSPPPPAMISAVTAAFRTFARDHRRDGRRAMLGLAGAPGSGKSTLAAALAAEVPGAVVVPMDGFHLPTSVLAPLGRVERRGAPDTFDAAGYVALLRSLRVADGPVLAPLFDRSREEPVLDALEIPAGCPLVITEGNYLLLDEPPWTSIPDLLDECWFVDVPEALRVERLIARFVAFGTPSPEAHARVTGGSDAANARVVETSRHRADAVVAID